MFEQSESGASTDSEGYEGDSLGSWSQKESLERVPGAAPCAGRHRLLQSMPKG